MVINEDQHENKNLEEKASKVGQSEDAVAVIQEFQKIIKSKKKNTIWSVYQQCKIFQKFKENSRRITKRSIT